MVQVYHKRLLVSSLFPSLALRALVRERASTRSHSSHRLPQSGKREASAVSAKNSSIVSCVSSGGVVNIDNSFGAAILASHILRAAARIQT
jgi:hypothetical protein